MKRWRLQRRRHKVADSAPTPLAELARAPLPDAHATARQVTFVCLDIETSGLDAQTAELLSVGWVEIRDGRVAANSARCLLAQPDGEVGDSATVHGLTDTAVSRGQPLDTVIDAVVAALTGCVLVVHHAGLDKAVLDRLCRARYGHALPVPVLDTLALAHKRRQRRHHVAGIGSLRLPDLRTDYGLPRYQSHDCLVDALATAELLLAMLAHEGRGGDTPVWHWLTL
ncbi:MAG: exonuclease domain-containing protein [Pseudomonadota bacterium]